MVTGWADEFSWPLGAPLGPAVLSGGVHTRKFASGTSVTLKLADGSYRIDWSDGGPPTECQTGPDSATDAAPPVQFTISGHSSGGAMASSHFFAFSDRITGMGQLESCATFSKLADAQALQRVVRLRRWRTPSARRSTPCRVVT